MSDVLSTQVPILAIDPGPTQSAWVVWDGERVLASAIEPNESLLHRLKFRGIHWRPDSQLVVEMIACYGMAVGAEVFETCIWIGRYLQAWEEYPYQPAEGPVVPARLFRKDIKLHLCGSTRAKDPNVRQALIDRFGGVGTKKAPGRLYGIKSHLWAALAVAVAWWEGVR